MMWFSRKTSRGRTVISAATFLLMTAALAACGDDAPTEATTSTTLGSSDASAILSDMTGDLGLTDEQTSALQAIAEEYADRLGEPGVTWYVAADIQDVLTSEQIETIEARQEQLRERIADRMASGGAAARGQGGQGFGQHGMRGRSSGPRGIGGGPWTALDLTDAQVDAIQDILEGYRPELEALRDQVRDGSLTRDEAHEQATAIRDAIRAEVEALLTPEQLAELDELREAHQDRRADREEARQQAHEAMVDALALTAEQQSAIDALRDTPRTGETREERRESHRAALEGILTAEQLEIVTIHAALRGHGLLRLFSGGNSFEGGGGFGRRGPGGFMGGSGSRA